MTFGLLFRDVEIMTELEAGLNVRPPRLRCAAFL